MSDDAITLEKSLRELYYDPVFGYQSAQKLHEQAKKEGLNVSFQNIKHWLQTQKTYTRFKPIQKNFKGVVKLMCLP